MGADEFVFRVGLLDSLAFAEAHLGYHRIEAAKLAEILEVLVHLLVADDGESRVADVGMAVVFVEDFLGEFVQIDGKAVIGLLRGDVHRVADDVGAFERGHIGVTQAGEGAEAEEVAGLGEAAGIFDNLDVFLAGGGVQGHALAVAGDFKVVEVQQFFLGEEDDRFLQHLELRSELTDLALVAVALADGPVQKPFEVVELLLDSLLLQAFVNAQESDETVEPGLVEVGIFEALAESLHVMREGCPALHRPDGPGAVDAFLTDEFLQVVEDVLFAGRCFDVGLLLSGGDGHFFLEVIDCRIFHQVELVVGEMGADL